MKRRVVLMLSAMLLCGSMAVGCGQAAGSLPEPDTAKEAAEAEVENEIRAAEAEAENEIKAAEAEAENEIKAAEAEAENEMEAGETEAENEIEATEAAAEEADSASGEASGLGGADEAGGVLPADNQEVQSESESVSTADSSEYAMPANDYFWNPLDYDLTYSDLTDREFYFSSGAGGWATLLKINSDGSFTGNYYDSDMGDTGEGYPNGVMYDCVFNGKFGELKRINDYVYCTEIQDMTTEKEPGTEEIIDGVLYKYSYPYGLEDSQRIIFFVQGTPISVLPEEYKGWVYWEMGDAAYSGLPFYGIYNEAPMEGFSSYLTEINAKTLEREVREIQNMTDDMNEALSSGFLSQVDLNMISGEAFKLWDGALNDIWGYLKKTLSSDEMDKLTKEEREWIDKKEKAVKEAGSEFEGGSMQALIENDEAAVWTRERVYELMEYVR